MLISEFIKELQQAQARYGDKPILVRHNHQKYRVVENTIASANIYISFAAALKPFNKEAK